MNDSPGPEVENPPINGRRGPKRARVRRSLPVLDGAARALARHRHGAGFVVALAGDVMTMPGLPKVSAAERIDIDDDGQVVGLS